MADKITPLVAAKAVRRTQLTEAAAARLHGHLATFDGWYDDRLVSELAGHLGTTANSAARLSATQMDAYLTRIVSTVTGRPATHGPALQETARAGVDAATAYERLGMHYRYTRSRGESHEGALRSVVDRANRMVQLDVALTGRAQARNTLAANEGVVSGFRRVLRPELAKTGTCGLCIAAADQVYSTFDLLPIHGGCNCEVAPIIGDDDPGDHLNRADLTRLYDAADGTSAEGLRKVRARVFNHGEYGPILTDVEGSTRTMYTVREDARNARVVELRLEIADHEKALSQALAERSAGHNRDDLIRTHKTAIDRLALELTRAT